MKIEFYTYEKISKLIESLILKLNKETQKILVKKDDHNFLNVEKIYKL